MLSVVNESDRLTIVVVSSVYDTKRLLLVIGVTAADGVHVYGGRHQVAVPQRC